MTASSKHRVYLAIGAAVVLIPLLVANLWGDTWPHTGYHLHLRETGNSQLLCNGLSTMPGQIRVLTPRTGYKGCFIAGVGDKLADGTLQLRARPAHPLNVQAWPNWDRLSSNLGADELDGYCANDEFLSTAPVSKDCERYRTVLQEHFQVPPAPM